MLFCFCFSAFLYSSIHLSSPSPFSRLFVSGGGSDAASVNEAEVDGSGNGELHFAFKSREIIYSLSVGPVSPKCTFFSAVFSFPSLPNEESLIGVSKPLPKQLWEAKKVRLLLTHCFSAWMMFFCVVRCMITSYESRLSCV